MSFDRAKSSRSETLRAWWHLEQLEQLDRSLASSTPCSAPCLTTVREIDVFDRVTYNAICLGPKDRVDRHCTTRLVSGSKSHAALRQERHKRPCKRLPQLPAAIWTAAVSTAIWHFMYEVLLLSHCPLLSAGNHVRYNQDFRMQQLTSRDDNSSHG